MTDEDIGAPLVERVSLHEIQDELHKHVPRLVHTIRTDAAFRERRVALWRRLDELIAEG